MAKNSAAGAKADTASLTTDEVRKIAVLARLHLDDADVEKMTRQLGAILGYVQQLGEVNTDGGRFVACTRASLLIEPIRKWSWLSGRTRPGCDDPEISISSGRSGEADRLGTVNGTVIVSVVGYET